MNKKVAEIESDLEQVRELKKKSYSVYKKLKGETIFKLQKVMLFS